MAIGKRKILPITLSIMFILLLWGAYFLSSLNNYHSSILVGGSTTVHNYTLALAEEFMKDNEETSIYCESGGSTPGLIAVKNGAIDIAVMSRDLEDDEDDKYIKNYLIGKDGLGIIVHPSNPVSNLTVEQVSDIFSGAVDETFCDFLGGGAGCVRRRLVHGRRCPGPRGRGGGQTIGLHPLGVGRPGRAGRRAAIRPDADASAPAKRPAA